MDVPCDVSLQSEFVMDVPDQVTYPIPDCCISWVWNITCSMKEISLL